MQLDPTTFQGFCDLAYEQAGISLKTGKEALVAARVGKRLRALGLTTARDYLTYLQKDRAGEELVQFLDVISTNFTSFFREADHFTLLDELVRRRLQEGSRRLRFWCAASSTGEEPYTMAMVIERAVADSKVGGVDYRILATDISTRVLAKAAAARYPQRVVAKVESPHSRYLRRVGEEAGEPIFEVDACLRERIVFKRLNLATPPFPMTGPLDAVFCRNVMIYFDRPVRQQLVREIERLLGRNAPLFIGHSETLAGLDAGLKGVRPAVYAAGRWK